MRLVDTSEEQLARYKEQFPGSVHQRVLHNAVLAGIIDVQSKLETVRSEELLRMQGQITEMRRMLAVLHANDTDQHKKYYAS